MKVVMCDVTLERDGRVVQRALFRQPASFEDEGTAQMIDYQGEPLARQLNPVRPVMVQALFSEAARQQGLKTGGSYRELRLTI